MKSKHMIYVQTSLETRERGSGSENTKKQCHHTSTSPCRIEPIMPAPPQPPSSEAGAQPCPLLPFLAERSANTKDSPSKPSVAELAGRLKSHIIPLPTSNDELPFRRRLPCSLKLQNRKDDNEESDKAIVSQNPFKIKIKNSPVIEKLQANLALSPTALLPSPKSPEVKLQPAPLSPTTPSSQLSPTLEPSHLPNEEEDPVSFNNPPEATPLPSINKTRARLSFKRRPPTRQHRRSTGEEERPFAVALPPCELCGPKENGDRDQVFDSPAEEAEHRQPASLEEAEDKDRDCKNTEDEVAKSDPDNRRNMFGDQEAEQAQSLETFEEEPQPSNPCLTKLIDSDVKTEEGQEEMAQE